MKNKLILMGCLIGIHLCLMQGCATVSEVTIANVSEFQPIPDNIEFGDCQLNYEIDYTSSDLHHSAGYNGTYAASCDNYLWDNGTELKGETQDGLWWNFGIWLMLRIKDKKIRPSPPAIFVDRVVMVKATNTRTFEIWRMFAVDHDGNTEIQYVNYKRTIYVNGELADSEELNWRNNDTLMFMDSFNDIWEHYQDQIARHLLSYGGPEV